jgi:hypothetical protein
MEVIPSIMHHNYIVIIIIYLFFFISISITHRDLIIFNFMFTRELSSFLITINVFRFYFYHLLMKMLLFFFSTFYIVHIVIFFLWCCNPSFTEKIEVVTASVPLPIVTTLYNCVLFFYVGRY